MKLSTSRILTTHVGSLPRLFACKSFSSDILEPRGTWVEIDPELHRSRYPSGAQEDGQCGPSGSSPRIHRATRRC